MTITVEERIRRAAEQLESTVEPAYVDDAEPVRGRVWVVAAAVLLLAGAVGLATQIGGESTAPPATQPVLHDGWERLPEAPIGPRFQHLAVSTGDGLLVWGGYGGDTNRTDGAFYDATTRSWVKVPRAPLASDRGDAIGVWTGAEVVVVNGIDSHVKAAAYQPGTNAWRALPDPPLKNSANMMSRAVFVDGAVVVVAVSEEGEGAARNEVAVLDPATDKWRIGAGPSAPFGSGFDAVVVGSEMVVVARYGMGGKGCGYDVVLSYSPASDSWRPLDGPPTDVVLPVATASTGSEVFVVGAECGEHKGTRQAFLLNPATGAWRPAAAVPDGVRGDDRYAEVWTGSSVVLFSEEGPPVFYSPSSNTWRTAAAGPFGGRLIETPWAWVAGGLMVFSGSPMSNEGGCCDPSNDGYRLTPPGDGPGASG